LFWRATLSPDKLFQNDAALACLKKYDKNEHNRKSELIKTRGTCKARDSSATPTFSLAIAIILSDLASSVRRLMTACRSTVALPWPHQTTLLSVKRVPDRRSLATRRRRCNLRHRNMYSRHKSRWIILMEKCLSP